jgi:hypothetical protein
LWCRSGSESPRPPGRFRLSPAFDFSGATPKPGLNDGTSPSQLTYQRKECFMNQFNKKVVLVTGQTLAVDGGWTAK